MLSMSGLLAQKLPGHFLCLSPISLRTAGVRDVCYPLLIITKILKFQTLVLVFAQHALDLLSYLSNHVQLNIVVDS